jgi:hypothetical protein
MLRLLRSLLPDFAFSLLDSRGRGLAGGDGPIPASQGSR